MVKKVEIYKALTGRDNPGILKIIFNYFMNPIFKVNVIVNKYYNTNSRLKKRIIKRKLLKKYTLELGLDSRMGEGSSLIHYCGVIIGGTTSIGTDCKIYQGVILGQKNGLYPTIGDSVYIYSGAKVIGGVHIGNNCIIGANAVVINDIPDNCTAVGVPARIVKRG